VRSAPQALQPDARAGKLPIKTLHGELVAPGAAGSDREAALPPLAASLSVPGITIHDELEDHLAQQAAERAEREEQEAADEAERRREEQAAARGDRKRKAGDGEADGEHAAARGGRARGSFR
jgi:hypothetical protein